MNHFQLGFMKLGIPLNMMIYYPQSWLVGMETMAYHDQATGERSMCSMCNMCRNWS